LVKAKVDAVPFERTQRSLIDEGLRLAHSGRLDNRFHR
jgi:hypothetical protein